VAQSRLYDDGLRVFAKLRQLKHDCVKCTMHLVDTYARMERFFDAQDAVDKMLEVHSHDPLAWYEAGLFYGGYRIYIHGDWPDKALTYFDRALELDPSLYDARQYRIRVLYQLAHNQNQWGTEFEANRLLKRAIKEAEDALVLWPEDRLLREMLHTMMIKGKPSDPERGRDACMSLIERGAATEETYWNLAQFLDELGAYDQFLEALTQAMQKGEGGYPFTYERRFDPRVRAILGIVSVPLDQVIPPL
jgi:tetratricopeptide (TPR) repeat protein